MVCQLSSFVKLCVDVFMFSECRMLCTHISLWYVFFNSISLNYRHQWYIYQTGVILIWLLHMASTLNNGSSTTLCCDAKWIHRLELQFGCAGTKKVAIEYCLCHHFQPQAAMCQRLLMSALLLWGVSHACRQWLILSCNCASMLHWQLICVLGNSLAMKH